MIILTAEPLEMLAQEQTLIVSVELVLVTELFVQEQLLIVLEEAAMI